MSSTDTGSQTMSMESYRSPKTFIGRFIARRTSRSAFVLGVIFGFYMIAKASAFLKVYTTEAARQKLAGSLGSNVGIEALLGVAHHLETVGGYVVWNFLCLIAAGGAIWALLIATKTFRGEEDSGRWELLLAGQTTSRRAAANALTGLGSGLIIIYMLCAVAMLGIARLPGADITTGGSLFFALALVAGAAEFLAIGALTSQLMSVRSRATGLSATIFGVFYMIRLTADTTSAHWLLNVSPLGWIERLQPMYNSQPLWLLPIGGFIVLLSVLTIYFAGRRDLGSAIFADTDIDKPRTSLLSTPFTVTLRLNRSVILGWLIAMGLTAFFYGSLAKGAVKAFSQSTTAEHALNRLTKTPKAVTTTEFMGITFFLVMIMFMYFVASAIGRIRSDEAQGYLDNFLVQPVSRISLLWDRILLIFSVIIAAGLLSSVTTWAGEASQHGGVPFHLLIEASANAIVPALFVLGVGVFSFGISPRLTSILTYGVIAWSFLIFMLSSGLSINHWILDTSLLHHIALAPSASPAWTTNVIIIGIAIILCLIGTIAFNQRDLETE